MRKIYTPLSWLLLYCCISLAGMGQVVVTGSTGLDGNYPALGGASGLFPAIELGPDQTGNNILVTITADIPAEPGASLLFGRNWTSFKMIPSGNRTITSNVAGSIISLAFASNILVDGLNTGGNSLTLINNSTASLGSVAMLSNNSSFDTLRNLTCRASGVDDAVIFITNSSTGNHHNLIENCDISGIGGSRPTYGIVSISGPLNNDNTIRNCTIHDIYSRTADSYGIYIAFGAARITIENNHIYQTAACIPLSGNPTFTGIALGFTDGDGFIIRNNTIGGNAADGSGYAVFGSTATGPGFIGIRARHIGFSPPSFPSRTEITGNRIRGIDITSAKNNNAGGFGVFIGIDMGNGVNTDSVRCSSNIIGGASGIDSIIINALATVAVLPCLGIQNTSTRGNTIDSNVIGAVSLVGGLSRTSAFFGIQSNAVSAAFPVPIRNNIIGNADVANSIHSNHTGIGGNLAGIRVAGNSPNATYRITNNTIQNLQHTGANAGTGVTASVIGFVSVTGAVNKLEIENNTFRHLTNLAVTTSAIQVNGISWLPQPGAGAAPALIRNNQVYGLSVPNSTSASSRVTGMICGAGNESHIINNMVSVGNGAPGKVYGIEINGSTVKMYNNSFRVTGTGAITDGAALLRSVISTVDAKNNIYYNDRSGTPNNQYAVNFPAGFLAALPYTGSNNLCYSPGPNIASNSGINYATLAAFNTILNTVAPNAEINGRTAAITFTSVDDLHTTDIDVVNAGMNLSAATPAVTTDIDNDTRTTCYDIGADEVSYSPVPNTATWTGAIDTKWCTPCNWDKGIVPVATDNVIIPAGPLNFPLLNTAASCAVSVANDITINTGASVSISTGGVLELSGHFSNNGTYIHTGGDLILNGNAAQTISSSTAPLNFYNLQLNGSGLKQLTVNAAVNGSLTLTNGNLSIANNDLRATAISGGALLSHIITDGSGLLTIPAVGAGPVVFPMGPDAASYNALTFTNGQGIDFSARVEIGINPNIAFPGIAVNRTWTINSSSTPAAPVGVQFEYANGEANAGFNYTGSVEVGKYIAPTWNVIASGITPLGSYRVASDQTSFNSPFAIGNIGAFLAVDLYLQCQARKHDREAIISFRINEVDGVNNFEVQRSVNNGNFETLSLIQADPLRLEYSFTDPSTVPGINLYRIKANRRISIPKYSNIAAIINTEKGLLITSLHPNPVSSNGTVTISAAESGVLQISIIDLSGKTVKQWQVPVTEGSNQFNFSVLHLASGIYHLAATDKTNKAVLRFIKQ